MSRPERNKKNRWIISWLNYSKYSFANKYSMYAHISVKLSFCSNNNLYISDRWFVEQTGSHIIGFCKIICLETTWGLLKTCWEILIELAFPKIVFLVPQHDTNTASINPFKPASGCDLCFIKTEGWPWTTCHFIRLNESGNRVRSVSLQEKQIYYLITCGSDLWL